MLIVLGQLATACLMLLFGILALIGGVRTPRRREPHRSNWILTGVGFGCAGAAAAVQNTFAARAFLAGPESTVWIQYLSWAPAGNHGRALVVLAIGAGLALLGMVRQGSIRFTLYVAAVTIPLALLLGATVGWAEGPLEVQAHWLRLSAGNLVQMVLLATALLIHLSRDSMDRLLWICLAVYFLQLGLATLWTVAGSWFGIPGTTLPSPLALVVIGIAGYAIMLLTAARYAQHQRRKRHVPALLEHLRPMRVRTL